MALSTSSLQRLSQLLDESSALPAAARADWLAALSGDDAALRPRLALALGLSPAALQRFDSLPPLPLADDAGWLGQAGDRIGPYRLVAPLGRGGMGEVWRAARADGRFEREVALKIPRQHLGQDLAARLQFECQVAARLEHRHIARLYDAGLDADGRPWIASELIEGEALDAHVAARDLSLSDRLRLLVWVVGAVAYAHGRGVLHRDLKPANVRVDAEGVPHLLDFGIAALTDVPDGAHPAQRAFTPRYAAPEQLAGAPDTVQADVFSLGVIAYELLSGQRPVGLPGDADWRPPSEVAAPVLARRLRGDLDAVVASAMARDPAHRCETAALLADELTRAQRGEPVRSRPLGPVGRASRTLRRHWLAGSATGAVLIALTVGGGVSLLQAQRAAQAQDRERAAQAFVADVLRLGRRQAPAAASYLDRGVELVAARFPDQPLLQLELFSLLAQSYAEMGDPGASLALQQRRWAVMATLPGALPTPAQRNAAQLDLAQAQLAQGLLDAAEQTLAALPGLPAESGQRAALLRAQLLFERGEIEAARARLHELDFQLPGQGLLRAQWQAQRAELHRRDGQPDACIAAYEAGAQAANAAGERQRAAELLGRAAYWAAELGQRERALALHGRAQAGLRDIGGLALVRAALDQADFWDAALRQPMASVAEATAGMADAQRQIEWLGDAVSPHVAASVQRMHARLLLRQGRLAEGGPLLEAALTQLAQREQRPLHRAFLHSDLGHLLIQQGRRQDAEHKLRAALADRQAAGFGQHPHVITVYLALAFNAMKQGDTAKALTTLDSAPDDAALRAAGHDPAWYRTVLTKARARVLLEAGRPQDTLALLAGQQAHRYDRELVGMATGLPWLQGQALCALGSPRDGAAVLRAAWQALNRDANPADAELQAVRKRSLVCAQAAGDVALSRWLGANFVAPAGR